MFAVFAAEQQYHHDTRTREQERLILAAIRERSTPVPALGGTIAPSRRHGATPVRPQRAAWPRPIGVHAHDDAGANCVLA
ncbi:hypothetical protein IF188_01585 [Microbacterium sp. NEAU-LLC]|uniref:Uncharacterized protein n=1 Tax=Microbacterium helvum TaxID=2773713 RepID=A0ABR8NI82_9MICO|nr:hypothetical protein [Microbacterium helvum]MBD3940390.1 hypothetical protein [Microbacterium helvum]